MRGLIIKDLLNLKKQAGYLTLFIALYAILSIYMGNVEFVAGMIILLCAILPITAMSYDERAKWDRYALSMPVSRRDVVLSKYMLGLLLILPGSLLALICGIIAGDTSILELLAIIGCCAGMGFLIFSVMLPIMFKIGVEKARIAIIIAALIPTLAIIAASKLSFSGDIGLWLANLSPATLAAVALLILAVVAAISISCSLRIYGRKEF